MNLYMIGDEYGNMYFEESDDFYKDKGTIFIDKAEADKILDKLERQYDKKDRDWIFKIWQIN